MFATYMFRPQKSTCGCVSVNCHRRAQTEWCGMAFWLACMLLVSKLPAGQKAKGEGSEQTNAFVDISGVAFMFCRACVFRLPKVENVVVDSNDQINIQH